MPKKRTAAVIRDKNGAGIELWSRGRKGASARPLFNPASPEAIAAMNRTLNHVPEVMVKVTGGGRDTGTAQAHLSYIDRHGKLDVHTDEGEVLNGKDVSQFLVEDWKLDISKSANAKNHNRQAPEPGATDKNGKAVKDSRGKQVHNIVLSMPQGTPPHTVLAAAQAFARENFALNHRYAMVLHDPATDPRHEKTESGKNPHVHLVVKAVSETGERLYIRKDTLRLWREQFAHALREQGVQANATPSALRGKGKSSAKSNIHQHQERLDKWRTEGQGKKNGRNGPVASTLQNSRYTSVLDEIYNGSKPDASRKEKLAATRANVVKDWLATATALREAGNNKDADRVLEFVKNLYPVKTDHQLLKEQVLADKDRLRAAEAASKPPVVDKPVQRGDDFSHER
ncbi:MAG: relaxase [Methyloglobulus sp.]|nr:relaxase [Methyloglobulus sp.]